MLKSVRSRHVHRRGSTKHELEIRNLLDDPGLRRVLGIAPDTVAPERPRNIRQLLELAAA